MAVNGWALKCCRLIVYGTRILPFNRLYIIEQRTVSYMDKQPIANHLCEVYSVALIINLMIMILIILLATDSKHADITQDH